MAGLTGAANASDTAGPTARRPGGRRLNHPALGHGSTGTLAVVNLALYRPLPRILFRRLEHRPGADLVGRLGWTEVGAERVCSRRAAAGFGGELVAQVGPGRG